MLSLFFTDMGLIHSLKIWARGHLLHEAFPDLFNRQITLGHQRTVPQTQTFYEEFAPRESTIQQPFLLMPIPRTVSEGSYSDDASLLCEDVEAQGDEASRPGLRFVEEEAEFQPGVPVHALRRA